MSAWLKKKYDFVPKKKREYSNPKDYVSEHKQIQVELTEHKRNDVSNKLRHLFELRKKADYPPLNKLTLKQVNDCINNMEYIFKRLSHQDLGIIV